MSDITILYYTSNTLREPFATRVRRCLRKAIDGIPLISVSQKPLSFGQNICVGDIGKSYLNIYRQILIGAKAAETDYVGLAEDDVLYSREHFTEFRPNLDTFAYDINKWSIYAWNPNIYSMKGRHTNTSLIAPRLQLISALEERFAKYPDGPPNLGNWGEPGRLENRLGVKIQKFTEFVATQSHIVFSHEDAVGYEYLGNRKRHGFIRAVEIPYWGRASELCRRIYG